MDTNYVLVCNKIECTLHNKFVKCDVDHFNNTVEQLASTFSKLWNLDKDDFDIVCFGKHLDFSQTLDSCGIQSGTILYLMKKRAPFVVPTPTNQTPEEKKKNAASSILPTKYHGMCIALKSALHNSGFRQILENICEFEKRQNLLVVNPELRVDPSMLGILGDAELLNFYVSRLCVKRVLDKYPTFLDVASHIAATFHEEISNVNMANNLVSRSSLMNYSIDNVSDDEEMDESESSSVSSSNTTSSNNRLRDTTPMSFSNMLMQAFQNRQLNNSGVITQDMLRQALQTTTTTTSTQSSSQASDTSTQESVPNTQSSPVASSSQSTSQSSQPMSTAQILIGWAPQLVQMRELGIDDDIVAIQALEATNGDVQAALNIIFSDFN